LEKLKQSPNYKKNAFQNLSDTPMKPDDISYWKIMKEFIHKNKNTAPPGLLPSVKTDLGKLNSSKPIIVWFGHSSYLIRIENKNFLIDPVFSGNAAPLSFMIKAFPGSNIYKPEDMPAIDYLILTHDHYDHLDFKTVRKLRDKVSNIYCSLGVSSHLKYWGFDINNITEMDWWESKQLDKNISLTQHRPSLFRKRNKKRTNFLVIIYIKDKRS
jgi:L-ascorbate metabolism protein UlaG (beta-lactamase superfamily)